MGYFSVRYDSRVVIYEHKMFIRLATGKKGQYDGVLIKVKSNVSFQMKNLGIWFLGRFKPVVKLVSF